MRLPSIMIILGLAGCHADDQLQAPPTPIGGALMARLVVMGNSFAAGTQSNGINDSTQREAFPFRLAVASQAPYFYQALAGRGCRPPLVNNVTGERIGGGTSTTTCDGIEPRRNPWLTNVAVPGARTTELSDHPASATSTSAALYAYILGGRTQAQAMAQAQPTLVILEIGINDLFGAVTNSTDPGALTLVTPAATFEAAYDAAAAAIASTGAPALLIGIPSPDLVPYLSTGSSWWCARHPTRCPGADPPPLPSTFAVSDACAPAAAIPGSRGDSIMVPWPKARSQLIQAYVSGGRRTLDCANDAAAVQADELQALLETTAAYNSMIHQMASAHGWAYWDPNPALRAARADGRIPALPNISALADSGPVLFGALFSMDGIHPNAAGQLLLADSVAATINAAFGTTIPVPVH